MIIWGTRLYGKVDGIEGIGYVATKFAHIWYIPVIPLSSWLVLAEHGEGWRGIPIGFSLKSIFVTWLRVGAIVAMLPVLTTLLADLERPSRYPRATRLGRLPLTHWLWHRYVLVPWR